MKLRGPLAIGLVCAGLALSFVSAGASAACTYTKTLYGTVLTDCTLTSKYDSSLTLSSATLTRNTTLVLSYPNLVVRSMDSELWTRTVQLFVNAENLNNVDAGGFDVSVDVRVIRRTGGAQVASKRLVVPFPGLSGGSRSGNVLVGTIDVPDRDYDYDVTVTATVDSADDVRESNETDNSATWGCTAFGYAAGQGVPGQYVGC